MILTAARGVTLEFRGDRLHIEKKVHITSKRYKNLIRQSPNVYGLREDLDLWVAMNGVAVIRFAVSRPFANGYDGVIVIGSVLSCESLGQNVVENAIQSVLAVTDKLYHALDNNHHNYRRDHARRKKRAQ